MIKRICFLWCLMAGLVAQVYAQSLDSNVNKISGRWEIQKVQVKIVGYTSGQVLEQYDADPAGVKGLNNDIPAWILFGEYTFLMEKQGRSLSGGFLWTGSQVIRLEQHQPETTWAFNYTWSLPSPDVLVLAGPQSVYRRQQTNERVKAVYTCHYRRIPNN